MLHNIEALKAAHAESLREAEEANRIALALPVVPKRVGFALKHTPWVHYEVDTLTEALAIFKQYTPAPYVIAKNSCFTVVMSEADLDRKNEKQREPFKVSASLDGAPMFDCMTGEGFSSTEMEFYTNSADRDLKICVRINRSPIRVALVLADPMLSAARRRYRKHYPEVQGAKVLQWGYADNCVSGSYWFPDLDTFWLSMEQYEGQ